MRHRASDYDFASPGRRVCASGFEDVWKFRTAAVKYDHVSEIVPPRDPEQTPTRKITGAPSRCIRQAVELSGLPRGHAAWPQ
jgi:hypothetical protein